MRQDQDAVEREEAGGELQDARPSIERVCFHWIVASGAGQNSLDLLDDLSGFRLQVGRVLNQVPSDSTGRQVTDDRLLSVAVHPKGHDMPIPVYSSDLP